MIKGQRTTVADAYNALTGVCLTLGRLCTQGEAEREIIVRMPLAMMTRHLGVFGSTGAGKTATLQGLFEQLSAAGVPVFVPDVKGDLSGMSIPGNRERVQTRIDQTGQDWKATANAVEYFQLGEGAGISIRVSVESFGAPNLGRIMGLTQVQSSVLEMIFIWAKRNELRLYSLTDLSAVLSYLVSTEGNAQLTQQIGRASSASLGVIQRGVAVLEDKAAEFFGAPEFDVRDFIRTTEDGRGVISMLELSNVARNPKLFTAFLYWLIDQVSQDSVLPEVGDLPAPKMAMVIDEAHLMFEGASKEFVTTFNQMLRLVRSKGLAIILVSQDSTDIPAPILKQLSSKIQHAVRAHTGQDETMLKKMCSTFPKNPYDLSTLIPTLPIGHSVVSVLGNDGSPLPVSWTVMDAPQSRMSPIESADITLLTADSALAAYYSTIGECPTPGAAEQLK